MNPGGIRADLTLRGLQRPARPPGVVTFGEAFTVQPFNNYLVSMDMTGAQIYALLEQQWAGPNLTAGARVLQVSAGFSYRWNPAVAAGSGNRVIPGSVKIGDTVVANDASQTFRVVANNFLAGGGDNFAAFNGATNKVIGGQDIDAFANYLPQPGISPYTPGSADPDHHRHQLISHVRRTTGAPLSRS